MADSFPIEPRRVRDASRSAVTPWTPVREEPSSALAPLDLREMVALLWRHVWLILFVMIAVGGTAAHFAYTASPSYQATAAIRLSDARRELTTGLDDPASAMVS